MIKLKICCDLCGAEFPSQGKFPAHMIRKNARGLGWKTAKQQGNGYIPNTQGPADLCSACVPKSTRKATP